MAQCKECGKFFGTSSPLFLNQIFCTLECLEKAYVKIKLENRW